MIRRRGADEERQQGDHVVSTRLATGVARTARLPGGEQHVPHPDPVRRPAPPNSERTDRPPRVSAAARRHVFAAEPDPHPVSLLQVQPYVPYFDAHQNLQGHHLSDSNSERSRPRFQAHGQEGHVAQPDEDRQSLLEPQQQFPVCHLG